MNTGKLASTETLHSYTEDLICWKSVIAGVFVAILTYTIFTALGTGIGGATASALISQETGGATGLAAGAVVWLSLSAVLSLFVGSYFSVRSSKMQTARVGIGQGIVVSAVFFLALVWALGSGIGSAAKSLTQTAVSAASTMGDMATNPMIQDTVNRAIGNARLKSPPNEVAAGLASRLISGNEESAKAYLAYQTGMSQAEVNARVTTMTAEFKANMKAAGEKAAEGVAAAGWSLFATLLLGVIAAASGGYTAAKYNDEEPVAVVTTDDGAGKEFVRVRI